MIPPPPRSLCACTRRAQADDYLTDEDGVAGASPKRGPAAMASSSLAGNGGARSSSSGNGGGRMGGGGGAEWAGVAGRGPPVPPRCDYVVDKVLGRKVFLVPVRLGPVSRQTEARRMRRYPLDHWTNEYENNLGLKNVTVILDVASLPPRAKTVAPVCARYVVARQKPVMRNLIETDRQTDTSEGGRCVR